MRVKVWTAAGAAIVLSTAMAACGSSSNSGGTANPHVGAPINVGVVTSLTGGTSSSFLTLEQGVKARLAVENAKGGVDGRKLTYVMADDTSTPAGTLSATQKLIKEDKVFAILDGSTTFFSGAPAAKAANMPVIGISNDGGPEWHDKSYTTFFDAMGYGDYSLTADTWGKIWKSQGCTKVGAVALAKASSARAGEAAVLAAQKSGLQKGYLNTQLPIGSTDVGPAVLGIKNSGTDCVYLPLSPSSAFAVAADLAQQGVKMKAVLMGTGYGADILANKAGAQAAQGVDFMTSWTPVEAETEATKAMQDSLEKYAGVTGIPTYGEYVGWTLADMFVYGLKKAGGDASQTDFVSALRNSDTWDAGGLFSKPTNFADPAQNAGGLGPGNCTNVVKLQGEKFEILDGLTPVCGDVIEGAEAS